MIATLAAALALAPSVGKPPRPPDVVLPLEVGDGQFLVHVKLRGQDAVFSLDSGSDEVRIQTDSAMRLGMVSGPVEIMRLVHTQSKETLELGSLKFDNVTTHVMRMFVDGQGNPIKFDRYDGIIGLEFLRKHGWGIDIPNKQLAIWRNGKLSEADVKAWAGPDAASTRLAPNRRIWNRYVIDGYLNGKKAAFLFDTGCPVLLQTDDQAKATGSVATVPIGGQRFLEGTWNVFMGVGPEVRLPWRTLTAPWVMKPGPEAHEESLNRLNQPGIVGVIGSETITDAKCVLDFPGRRMSVAVKSPLNDWIDYLGSFGLRVLFNEGKPGAAVRPGSPADLAGMKNLDLLETIEGQPVTPEIVSVPIPTIMGKPELTFTVRRGEETVKVTMRK